MSAAMSAKLRKLSSRDLSAALKALRSWSNEELANAAAWALGTAAEEGVSRTEAHYILAAWAERDFAAAWKAVSGLKPNNHRNAMMGTVLSMLARSDLDQVLTLVAQQPSASERSFILGDMMDHWGTLDPRGAVLAAFQRPELMNIHNATAWAAVAAGRQMSLADLEQLAAETGNPAAGPQLLRNALSRLTRENPQAVWQWYQSRATQQGQDPDFALIILREWWRKDPKSALQATANLTDGLTKLAALSQMEYWQPTKQAFVENVGVALDAGSPALRQVLLSQLAGSTLDQPDKLLALATNADERDLLKTARMRRLAQDQRFDEAAALVAQLESEPARQRALMRLGDAHAFHDARAAEAWVRQQPASPARDAALAGVVSHLAASNALSASALLPLFESPAARLAAQKTIAVHWSRSAPAVAKSWLAHQPALSSEDRAWVADAIAHGSPTGLFLPNGTWIPHLPAP